MKTAIVTGASSGIGRAISAALQSLGFRVYGFGRHFSQPPSPLFVPVSLDLTQTPQLLSAVDEIRSKEEIAILVNNAGVGYFGLHEELNPKKIHEMVTVNLEVPLILTQLLLRDLKKCGGHVINVSSVTANQASPHGCAYGATKAALSSFSRSLFEEARKYGVRVTALHPDMTGTPFYRNASFQEDPAPDCHLEPEDVAQALRLLLSLREGAVLTELTLRPQKHRIQRKKRISSHLTGRPL